MAERENNMPVWPGWETVRLIGRGSFGAVYEIRRDMLGETEHCAMKHISIPQSENEILEMRSEGQNEESISQTFAEQARAILTEYKLMTRLNSCPNVVLCYDVSFVEKNGGLGWDIDIRMELLTTLMQRLSEQQTWPESETLRLGKDMARALCACRELSILHRDVKPQNIFIAKDGRYKLGDFGIARIAEKSGSATMRTGTFAYMAPEVYHGKHYDETADQYSLGMVLYWLLNERRGPFVSVNTPREKEAALYRRMDGETIPAPAHGSEELKRIVLKCCAFDPKERFQSPEELLKALENAEFGVRSSELTPERRKERSDPKGAKKPSLTIEEKKAERSDGTAEQSHSRDKTAGDTARKYGTESAVRPGHESVHADSAGIKSSRPVEPKTEGKTGNGDLGSADSGKNKKKKWLPILIGAAAAVAALAVLLPKGGQKPAPTAAPIAAPTETPTASPTPVPTPAPTLRVEEAWNWSLEDGVLTIYGTGNTANYHFTDEWPWAKQRDKITRVVVEEGITGIGEYAFSHCTGLSDVELPHSVRTIGKCAFSSCTDLRAIEIPSGVTSIGSYAFYWCDSLTSVELAEGVTTICGSAFADCRSLASLNIPRSVTTIETMAFWGCTALREIIIPESVTHIEERAFESCTGLTAIVVESGNPNYQSVDGVLFSKDGRTLVCCPAGSGRTQYAVPEGVTAIGVGAFSDCQKMTSLEVPEGVTSIGEEAFFDCFSLRTIKIPESVMTIGDMAFEFCSELRSIEVESGNQYYCSADGVLFSKDGKTLVRYPSGKDQSEYVIPSGVTRIRDGAFEECMMLHVIKLPESVTTIGSSAFGYCPDLREIIIPDDVTSIGEYAFYSCESLRSIEIPESVQSIGREAFWGCENLRSIKIPESVQSIGEWAFDHCDRLTDLYYGGTKTQWEALVGGTYLDLGENVTIHFES